MCRLKSGNGDGGGRGGELAARRQCRRGIGIEEQRGLGGRFTETCKGGRMK